MKYKREKRIGKKWLKLPVVLVIVVALIFGGLLLTNRYYKNNLEPVDSSSTDTIFFTVKPSMPAQEVSKLLKEKSLIRNNIAFDQYVRSNGMAEKFIAGTYELSKNMSAKDIVDVLTSGKVATDLFTIYPSSTIAQIKEQLIDTGQFTGNQVEQAFNPQKYSGSPALVDLPEGATLEGFLYPDSYHFTNDTVPEDIIKQSLDEMAKSLTPEVRAGISSQGLSVYQGVVLASIIEREVGEYGPDSKSNDNRAKVAQVFLKRLDIGMKLESNATDHYPDDYDTYSIPGLPPAPIGAISKSSLKAVAHPASSNYLFFVSGSDCVTRFSETNDQHEELKTAYGVAKVSDKCQG